MFCSQCGTRNTDGALHCTQCGIKLSQPGTSSALPPNAPQPQISSPPPISQPYAPPPVQIVPGQVPNYMTQAILVTLFCCLPLGIVSIMKANEVNRRLLANDYAGAVQASNSNRTMLWIGFSVGLVISVIYILVTVANNS